MDTFFTTSVCIFVLYALAQFSAVRASPFRLKKRFSEKDICHVSSTTIDIVPSCPSTNETIKERSLRKNCQKYNFCQGHPLVYHCVRYKNRTAEVCAPKGIITGHCCAVFIEEVGRVGEDYEKPCSECPFHYPSNRSLMYPTCIANSTCKGQQNRRNKRSAHCNEHANESTGKDHQSEGSYILYVLVPVVVQTLLVGSLLAFFKHRNRFGQDEPTAVTKKEINDGNKEILLGFSFNDFGGKQELANDEHKESVM